MLTASTTGKSWGKGTAGGVNGQCKGPESGLLLLVIKGV